MTTLRKCLALSRSNNVQLFRHNCDVFVSQLFMFMFTLSGNSGLLVLDLNLACSFMVPIIYFV
jgi:hypothetical protein